MTYEFCLLWDMFLFTQIVFQEKNNHARLIFNLRSTMTIYSNSSSIFLIDYWQPIALMRLFLPNCIFSSDFGWFLMRKYKHSENCKVGGHHCLPKSTTGRKLKNC